MICFIQIMGNNSKFGPITKYYPMTLNVSDLSFIAPGVNNLAVLNVRNGEANIIVYTNHPYDDFIETLSGFQKVEVIEILA